MIFARVDPCLSDAPYGNNKHVNRFIAVRSLTPRDVEWREISVFDNFDDFTTSLVCDAREACALKRGDDDARDTLARRGFID